jgi:hypothetical protein
VTPAQRAEALARFRARLDERPPATDRDVDRIAALFGSIRLRLSRQYATNSFGVATDGKGERRGGGVPS